MKRVIFNLICLTSALAAVLFVTLWVRSYSRADIASVSFGKSESAVISSRRGAFEVQFFSVTAEYRNVVDFSGGSMIEVYSEPAREPFKSCWDMTWRRGAYSFAWNEIDARSGAYLTYVVGGPHWICVLLFLIFPVVWFWRRARKAVAMRCESCSYDMRGNPAATVCPECGRPITRTRATNLIHQC